MTRYLHITCESLEKRDERTGQLFKWSLELNEEAALKFLADVNEGRMKEPDYLGGKPWPPTKAWIAGSREVQEPIEKPRWDVGPFI